MSTCNDSDTRHVLSSYWYWGSNGIKLALAPPAIVFNAVLIYILTRCVLLHINVRFLLMNVSICSIVASVYLLEKAAATLIYYLSSRVCSLELSAMTCCIREAVYVLFKLPVLFSMLGLGVERVYSTKHAQTYTTNENPRLAIGILVFLWSLALASVGLLVSTAATERRITYCNALFIYDPVAVKVLAGVLLPLELIGVALYVYIWMASVRWSTSGLLPDCLKSPYHVESFALSSRLQRRHNVSITSMMLPSVVFHAVCWTTILGVAVAQVNLHQFSMETHLLVSNYLFYALALAHMTVHPLLCLWNCDMIRWEFMKAFPRLRNLFPPTMTSEHARFVHTRQQSHEAEKHFEMLTNMWEKHRPTPSSSRSGTGGGGDGKVRRTRRQRRSKRRRSTAAAMMMKSGARSMSERMISMSDGGESDRTSVFQRGMSATSATSDTQAMIMVVDGWKSSNAQHESHINRFGNNGEQTSAKDQRTPYLDQQSAIVDRDTALVDVLLEPKSTLV